MVFHGDVVEEEFHEGLPKYAPGSNPHSSISRNLGIRGTAYIFLDIFALEFVFDIVIINV